MPSLKEAKKIAIREYIEPIVKQVKRFTRPVNRMKQERTVCYWINLDSLSSSTRSSVLLSLSSLSGSCSLLMSIREPMFGGDLVLPRVSRSVTA